MHHSYWALALEPVSQNYWARAPQLPKPAHSRACVPQLLSLHAATTEARTPRARAPRQEKPQQMRSLRTAMKGSPGSPQLEKARVQQQRPNAAEIKNK